MAPMRCMIVDDERLARDGLRILLGQCAGAAVEVVAEADRVADAAAKIAVHNPDVVFLDINMPGSNGFDIFQRVPASVMPLVVFVTAHAEYAVQGFEADAADYLLKPVSRRRVAETLTRLRARLAAQQATTESPQHLWLTDCGQRVRVAVQDIVCVQAAGDNMCVATAAANYVHRKTMLQLLAELKSARFVRLHRSTLINTDHVRGIKALDHGRYELLLSNGTRVNSSRQYRAVVQALLHEH